MSLILGWAQYMKRFLAFGIFLLIFLSSYSVAYAGYITVSNVSFDPGTRTFSFDYISNPPIYSPNISKVAIHFSYPQTNGYTYLGAFSCTSIHCDLFNPQFADWIGLYFNSNLYPSGTNMQTVIYPDPYTGFLSQPFTMESIFPLGTYPTTTSTLSPDPVANGQYSGPVTVTLSASANSSIAHTYYRVDGGAQQTYTSPFTVSGTGNHTVVYWSIDINGNQESGKTRIFTINQPPAVDARGPYPVNEGGSVQVIAFGTDPENSPLTYAWDLDNEGGFETTGQEVSFSAVGHDGPTSKTIAVQVTDDGGLTATDQATVNVTNAAPSVGAITAPLEPVAITTVVNASANFTDPGISDTHSAIWEWGDGTTSVGTAAGGVVSGNHTFTLAGVYTLKVTVTDDESSSAQQTFQFVVAYNSSGGFVTGGGWIESPSGAYIANPAFTGKANFGFVSKYEPGATIPTGQTKFQFKVGDLNFDSTVYDWLVVAGPNAKYKGTGTINGEGDYGFMLTARDGQVNGGGGVDRFWFKIWENATGIVIYDNQLGSSDDADATDAIEAGNIIIHH